MTDLDEMELAHRLRRTYRAVAERTVVTLDAETLARREAERPDADRPLPAVMIPLGPRRPTRRTVLRMAAALVALAGVGAAVGTRALDRPAEDGEEMSTAGDEGQWEQLPDVPIATFGHGTVWTGSELIVFGGSGDEPASTEVAAYDPERRSWRRLADLPDAVQGARIGVWTGEELVAFPIERAGVGAVYDPATDAWPRQGQGERLDVPVVRLEPGDVAAVLVVEDEVLDGDHPLVVRVARHAGQRRARVPARRRVRTAPVLALVEPDIGKKRDARASSRPSSRPSASTSLAS
jgi:hypothetical protein